MQLPKINMFPWPYWLLINSIAYPAPISLIRVIPDKVQRAIKWCVCTYRPILSRPFLLSPLLIWTYRRRFSFATAPGDTHRWWNCSAWIQIISKHQIFYYITLQVQINYNWPHDNFICHTNTINSLHVTGCFPDELKLASSLLCSFLHLSKNRTFENKHITGFYGQIPFLSPKQQCQSTEGNSKHQGISRCFVHLWTLKERGIVPIMSVVPCPKCKLSEGSVLPVITLHHLLLLLMFTDMYWSITQAHFISVAFDAWTC